MTRAERSLMWCATIVALSGILYLFLSRRIHDSSDPSCPCPVCITDRIPQEGEYLYNHYLFVLSLVWIAILICMAIGVRQWTEKKKN